jgi:hypothetical protein
MNLETFYMLYSSTVYILVPTNLIINKDSTLKNHISLTYRPIYRKVYAIAAFHWKRWRAWNTFISPAPTHIFPVEHPQQQSFFIWPTINSLFLFLLFFSFTSVRPLKKTTKNTKTITKNDAAFQS